MNAPAWLQRWVASHVSKGSLHRQLLLYLLLPQLVLWIAAAFVTYNVAARYANQGIDASLAQATRALARQVKPVGNGLLIDFPRAAQDIIEADPDDRVYYMVSTPPGQFILGNKRLPLPAAVPSPRLREPYFYDGSVDGLRIRLAALYLPAGEDDAQQLMLVQIARSQASRDGLARSILVDTVLPLSALIALMTMIVWAGIRAGLAPLARLRALVENRAPTDLAPLELEAAPTELRSLAGALNGLLGTVQESVTAQRRFIGNAAHQLRTPLAGLKSQTEIALETNTDPALAQRLKLVHQGAVRSAHLVNQLLSLARAEPEATEPLPREAVDLRALAAEVAAEQVPRALQQGVDLGVDLGTDWGVDPGSDTAPDGRAGADAGAAANGIADAGAQAGSGLVAAPTGPAPIRVWGAPSLLREALGNLVDNAIRYAGRGAEVTLIVRAEGANAVLDVADNGVGVPGQDPEALFGRFYRATHEGSGAGLGLAIVREIVQRHGGHVHAMPEPPHGLRVRMVLPRIKD